MPSASAGLLLYRRRAERIEVLLAHPGGPFFRNRDDGAWTVPKGEIEPGHDPLDTALREFEEEIGHRPDGDFIDLGRVRQRGGKIVQAWAVAGDLADDREIHSNMFELEWPPRSGRRQMFPEIDRAEFFDLGAARKKINPAQVAFLDRLEAALAGLA